MYSQEPIKKWKDNQPREKLQALGARSLSVTELLAIILGSGIPTVNVIRLSENLLEAAGNSLNELSRWPLEQLTQIKGIGPAKATLLLSHFELGNRALQEEVKQEKVLSSSDAYHLFLPKLKNCNTEEFWACFLNRSNSVIRLERMSKGGVASTLVDPKVIYKRGLLLMASSIIVAHNHPSGNLKASESDKNVTKQLSTVGKALEMPILDHIIITAQGYFSFADSGLL